MAWLKMGTSQDGRTTKVIHDCGRERWIKGDEDPPCDCVPCATRLLSIEPVEVEARRTGWLAKFYVPDLSTGTGQLRIAWARYLGMPMDAVRTYKAISIGNDVYGVYFQIDEEPTIDERFRRMVETAVTNYLEHQLADTR
jgi:hypothetical protein